MEKLFYKPILDSESLEVTGVQVAISDDLQIGSLEWLRLFEKACGDLKKLHGQHMPLQFFVFPLGQYLGDLKEISLKILNVLKIHDFNPSFVKFEISTMETPLQMMEFMRNFKEALKSGIRLVVSKFPFKALGIARYFRSFISILKLDLNSVKGLSQNSLIKVAQKCGFKVTASKLETEEDVDCSRAAGTNFLEGDYIAGFMPYDQLTHWAKMRTLRFT